MISMSFHNKIIHPSIYHLYHWSVRLTVKLESNPADFRQEMWYTMSAIYSRTDRGKQPFIHVSFGENPQKRIWELSTERPCYPQGLKPVPSCYEATVLTTAPSSSIICFGFWNPLAIFYYMKLWNVQPQPASVWYQTEMIMSVLLWLVANQQTHTQTWLHLETHTASPRCTTVFIIQPPWTSGAHWSEALSDEVIDLTDGWGQEIRWVAEKVLRMVGQCVELMLTPAEPKEMF